ncbi:MAG: glycosyltransferase family 9 protein [Bacteroidota bacterium]
MPIQLDRDIVRRLLVIKLRAIGDVLLSTIVTRNLREFFPESEIHFLTERASIDVLRGNPFIDAVVVYDRKTMTGADLIRRVRKNGYDLVFDLFGNPRSALVTYLSGAGYRVGFRFRARSYAYNIVVPPRGGVVHNTQFNLDALEAVGVPIVDRNIYFTPSPEAERSAQEYFSQSAQGSPLIVGINTGGGWYTKRWGLDRYALLADRLVEVFGATILLTWGPGQLQEAREVASLMKHAPLIPPPTSLSELGALLKRCSILVSNDSGPMHIAAAVGTPVLGIYGPTNPTLQGPFGTRNLTVRKEGLDCLGCNLTSCPIGHPCMQDLPVDRVLEGVELLLKKIGIQPAPGS